MAFIRKKTVGDKQYAQVVESYRDNGKVKQRVLLHLGEYTPAQALHYWTKYGENRGNSNWQRWQAKAQTLRGLLEQGKVSITEKDMRQVEADSQAKLEKLEQILSRL